MRVTQCDLHGPTLGLHPGEQPGFMPRVSDSARAGDDPQLSGGKVTVLSRLEASAVFSVSQGVGSSALRRTRLFLADMF